MNQVDHIDLSDEGVAAILAALDTAILAALDTAGLTVHHHETDGDHINLRLNPLAEYGAIVLSWRADEQGWLLAEYGEQPALLWYLGYIGMDNAITRTAVILADNEADEADTIATRTAQAREELAAQVRADLARHDAKLAGLRAQLEQAEAVRWAMVAMLAELEQDASQPAPTTHTVELPDGHLLQVVTRDQHDAQCRWRVATPQDTTPAVLHCAGCGLAYPAKDGAR